MSDVAIASPASSRADEQQIRAFYDEHIVNKIADFVDGNPRVDAAWRTIVEWAPESPQRVLDIGCGFGQISWQMASRWPHANVMGLDISPRSIALASKVFQLPNLSYATSALESLEANSYDLVTMIDVYEHIADQDRTSFNASLARLLSPTGVLIVTCPTPAYQQFLREQQPDKLQPVDEDIDLGTLTSLADRTRSRLVMFREQSIWMRGDYEHAVLTRATNLTPVRREAHAAPALLARVNRKLRQWRGVAERDSRDERLRMIERSLGAGVYRPR